MLFPNVQRVRVKAIRIVPTLPARGGPEAAPSIPYVACVDSRLANIGRDFDGNWLVMLTSGGVWGCVCRYFTGNVRMMATSRLSRQARTRTNGHWHIQRMQLHRENSFWYGDGYTAIETYAVVEELAEKLGADSVSKRTLWPAVHDGPGGHG